MKRLSLILLLVSTSAVTTSHLHPASPLVLALLGEESVYAYALRLEQVGLDPRLSHYSYRSGGSEGATAAGQWIYRELRDMGIPVWKEVFHYVTWNLYSEAEFTLDRDGDPQTMRDRVKLESFTPLHLSWPSHENSFKKLAFYTVGLPVGNLSDRIVLVGFDDLRFRGGYGELFAQLSQQRPYAVLYTYTHPGSRGLPPILDSAEGKLYWPWRAPSGWLSYEDALQVKRVLEEGDPAASLRVESRVSFGPHYNIVGELRGEDSKGTVIISAHYDTVLTPGLVDNSAGVAGLLELAKAFSQARRKGLYASPFTLRFIAFASEELGLLGSLNYVYSHRSELGEVVGVINLDSIGGRRLTAIGGEGELKDKALQAARDLGVQTILYLPGIPNTPPLRGGLQWSMGFQVAADHLSFADPKSAQRVVEEAWPGYPLDISDLNPVPAITLSSRPLFPRILGGLEEPGWIHTPYDNSTTPGWGRPENLLDHVRVVALTVLRFHGIGPRAPPSLQWVVKVAGLTSILIGGGGIGLAGKGWVECALTGRPSGPRSSPPPPKGFS